MAKEAKAKGFSFFNYVVLPAILAAILFPVWKTINSGDPLSHMYPNFLLFTPYREEVKAAWKDTLKFSDKVHVPEHIPTIPYSEFTMEKLKEITNNFRSPAIVRDMFKGTAAHDKWGVDGYLSSKIGDFMIPVVRNAKYNTLQNDRAVLSFREAFTEIVNDANSKVYMFFPVKSRFSFNHSELGTLEVLQSRINEVVLEDLEIDKRIWNGFGTNKHSTYFGSQLIIGQGSNDAKETTGTGWHCAAGNNWFVQAIGRKRWFFLDPKYSAYMFPLRGGKVNMMTGNFNMSYYSQFLPVQYGDLNPGDMLYNPDWQWHTIQNFEGLSIGVPIREVNFSLSFQNNFQYTSIVTLNKLMDKFGVDIGGYPPV
jgi:hypothetical protein